MTAIDSGTSAVDAPLNRDTTAAALRAERDFLLRSIADLEAEHRAGELSAERFRNLHDRYTVRAATVLRALERLQPDDLNEAHPATSARGGTVRRVAAITAALALFAAVGAVLMLRATGERQPGQTITGNAQSIVPAGDVDALQQATRDRPDDPQAHMAYASALLEAGKTVDALRAFDTAARLDPTDPAPKAYGGWIVSLAGLTDEAMVRLDAAVAADPNYPDARFFRGMTLLRGRNDRAAALVELREYLRLAPAGPERDQVQSVVRELEAVDPSASP